VRTSSSGTAAYELRQTLWRSVIVNDRRGRFLATGAQGVHIGDPTYLRMVRTSSFELT
jgi:hypothetical protein